MLAVLGHEARYHGALERRQAVVDELEICGRARAARLVVIDLTVLKYGVALIVASGISKDGHQRRLPAREERAPHGAEVDGQEGVPIRHEKGLVERASVEGEPQRATGAAQLGAFVDDRNGEAPATTIAYVVTQHLPSVPHGEQDLCDAHGRQP